MPMTEVFKSLLESGEYGLRQTIKELNKRNIENTSDSNRGTTGRKEKTYGLQ